MRFPGWYTWGALVLATMASIGLNVVVSINLAQRTIRAEQEAERKAEEMERTAREQAAEDSRKVTCEVVRAQIDVYHETAPVNPVQRNAELAWQGLAARFNCTQAQGGK